MSRQTLISKKKRGPPPTGQGTPIVTRMHPPQLEQLDAWIARQDDAPSRPEAIRRLLERGLAAAHSDAQVESRAGVLKRALSSEPAKTSTKAQPRRQAKKAKP
jgi:hypothetical protein